jgi:putative ABC transport system substrate-binding protein
MKGIILSFTCLLAAFVNYANATVPSVFISQIIEHPALDRTREGIIDALKEEGFKIGESLTLRWESAQGNPTLTQQIAYKFVSNAPDILVGIGTVSAQSFIKISQKKQTKIVFSSITDPIGAGLVTNLEKPQNNISGVSNFVPLDPQLLMFKKLCPQMKRLGVLYNMGEANSVSIVKKMKEICPRLGLILVPKAISKTADVAQGVASLAPQVDAIFISNDNTSLSAIGTIIKVAEKSKKPVFVSDVDAVEKGALAALGPNQYEVGLQTGRMVSRLLKGEPMANQRVEFPQKVELYLNEKVARKLGIILPQELRAQAAKIISEVS